MSDANQPADPVPTSEERLRAVTVGPRVPHEAPIALAEYDPTWPRLFECEAAKIRAVLGDFALRIEHVGSTSVPGLAAKPIIDIVLVVKDSADEASYVPALEGAGYVLRIREPDWYEHRMFKGLGPAVNLHVFSEGCPEVARMLAFRNRLRHNEPDREIYESVKRNLAKNVWKHVQNYADAKSAVVKEILSRAT